MSKSAFGVDHEISKAMTMPKVSLPKMPKPQGAVKPLARLGNAMGNRMAGMSKPLGQRAGRNIAQGNNRMAGAQMRMGAGAKSAGRTMMANPTATGAAATGAGVGAAGYATGFRIQGPGRRREG